MATAMNKTNAATIKFDTYFLLEWEENGQWGSSIENFTDEDQPNLPSETVSKMMAIANKVGEENPTFTQVICSVTPDASSERLVYYARYVRQGCDGAGSNGTIRSWGSTTQAEFSNLSRNW